MTDREKVIEGLEKVWDAFNHMEHELYADYVFDALALLKEQEAVEPIPPTDELVLWRCGNCNHQLFRCTHQRYCEMCGRSVKWE